MLHFLPFPPLAFHAAELFELPESPQLTLAVKEYQSPSPDPARVILVINPTQAQRQI